MNENPLLAPEAKEKLITLIEEMLHDFNYRVKRNSRVIAKNLLAYDAAYIGLHMINRENKSLDKYHIPEPEGNGLIAIELNSDTFKLDDFVSAYVENEAPSAKVVIKFFEGNRTLNDAAVTITLDSNYWDEEELEMCAFRLTADFEEADPFKVKGADGLSDKELEILEKAQQRDSKVYDSLEVIYDVDVYQMKISHIVAQD